MAPKRQVRPARRRVCRPRGPFRPGQRDPQFLRRPGRDDPGAARGPLWCDKGPHPAGAQLDALIVTAPEPVRGSPAQADLQATDLRVRCHRPGPVSDPASAVKTALRALARRWQAFRLSSTTSARRPGLQHRFQLVQLGGCELACRAGRALEAEPPGRPRPAPAATGSPTSGSPGSAGQPPGHWPRPRSALPPLTATAPTGPAPGVQATAIGIPHDSEIPHAAAAVS